MNDKIRSEVLVCNKFVMAFPLGKVKCGFHSCCGRNIRLVNNKMTASRSTGFNHGLVFSAKPLEEDEIFEVINSSNFYCGSTCGFCCVCQAQEPKIKGYCIARLPVLHL